MELLSTSETHDRPTFSWFTAIYLNAQNPINPLGLPAYTWKGGAAFVKVGVLVRYRPEDLEAWLNEFPAGGPNAERFKARLKWLVDPIPGRF